MAWCLLRLPVSGLTQYKQQLYIDDHAVNLQRIIFAVKLIFSQQIQINQDRKGRCNTNSLVLLSNLGGFVLGGGLMVTD